MHAPFDLIEVEPGRRLHVLVEGPEDAPWVIFDHGAFGTYADGWWVKEALKTDHRVVLYGRAGMDWSDPAPEGALLTPEFHIADLQRLLARLGGARALRAGWPLHGGPASARLRQPSSGRIGGPRLRRRHEPEILAQERRHAGYGILRNAVTGRTASIKNRLLRAIAPFTGDDINLPRERRTEKRFLFRQTDHWTAALGEVTAIDAMAAYFDPAVRVNCPVAVFSRAADGGENANVPAEPSSCVAHRARSAIHDPYDGTLALASAARHQHA
jgi:hypothetical protein